MRIEQYIQELLYRYQCVTVPGFGAFLTQNKPAILQKNSNTFYPPSRTLSFNEQIQGNDGLLVSHLAQVEQKTFEESSKEIETFVREWKRRLHSGEKLELSAIGALSLGAEKKILFTPETEMNYLPASFGLNAVVAHPVIREVYKEEVSELEENIPFVITPETRNQNSGLRPFLKYAAVLFLAFSLGASGVNFYRQHKATSFEVQQLVESQVNENIQEATFFDLNPVTLPSIKLNVNEVIPSKGKHHIIAGAFRIRGNAQKKIDLLLSKGYPAFYLGTNKFGLHQVAYSSFDKPSEALKALKKIRATEHPDAWLLSEK